jgi:hypothetical protein
VIRKSTCSLFLFLSVSACICASHMHRCAFPGACAPDTARCSVCMCVCVSVQNSPDSSISSNSEKERSDWLFLELCVSSSALRCSWSTIPFTSCVRVFVCVCVRERKREEGGGVCMYECIHISMRAQHSIHTDSHTHSHTPAYLSGSSRVLTSEHAARCCSRLASRTPTEQHNDSIHNIAQKWNSHDTLPMLHTYTLHTRY